MVWRKPIYFSYDTDILGVLLGDHNLYTLTPSQKFMKVAEKYVHPNYYQPTPLNNDIALLRLSQSIAFSSRYLKVITHRSCFKNTRMRNKMLL